MPRIKIGHIEKPKRRILPKIESDEFATVEAIMGCEYRERNEIFLKVRSRKLCKEID
jgi:hypothetical protein